MNSWRSKEAKGGLALLAGAGIIGSYGTFIVFVSDTFGIVTQTLIRFGGSAVLIALLLLLRHRQKGFGFSRKYRHNPAIFWHVLIVTIASIMICLLLSFALMQGTPVVTSMAILYSMSIASSVVIGRLLFDERPNYILWISVGLVLMGLAIYGGRGIETASIGIVAVLAAGICDAAANGSRKYLGQAIGPLYCAFWQYLLSIPILAVILLLFLVFQWETPVIIDNLNVPSIIAMTCFIIVTSLMSALVSYGMSRRLLGLGSVILASQVLFAAVFAYAFLGQVPQLFDWIGIGLIALSTFVAAWGGKRKVVARTLSTQAIEAD